MRRCSGARDAFHRRRPRERSCESPAWSAAHVGQRGRPPHIFIDVREHRLDLSSPALACEIEAACAPAASADRCFHEHDQGPHEHPNHRICGWGDCPVSTELPRSRAITERLVVRGRGKPLLDAPRGDCSSRRLCPDLDRSGRLLSRPSLSRPVRSDAGREGYRHRTRACMARERQGRATPSFREETRRSPTRGTFHHEAVRERTKAPATQQAERQCADAFFTAFALARGTPARDADSSANRMRKPANQLLVDRPQRPS